MDMKVKKGSVDKIHKPCAFNPEGANQETCRAISCIVSKNHGGCAQSNCHSLWRLCAVCITKGGKPEVVAGPGERLCEFHKKKGVGAERPRVDTSSLPLPRRNKYDEGTSLKPSTTSVTSRKEVAKTPEVGRKEVKKAPPPLPPQKVESTEEGRAILERVRNAISSATYEIVPIERIRAMANQPRKHFNPERLLRLSESIKQVGQITPGYLRRVDLDSSGHDRELVDGERRWRGILMAGVSTFRAMLVEVDDEAAQYIVSVIANFNREGHTALEIADSIKVMHENLKLQMQEIAESIGFHPVYVTNLYGLRRLAPAVRAMLDPDIEDVRKLPVSAAIEISRLPEKLQEPLALRVLRREVNLRTLRSEVVKLSKEHGLPIQKKTVEPFDQRRSIERKIILLRRSAADLKQIMDETPKTVLSGWGIERAHGYRTEVEKARDEMNAILSVFDEMRKPK